MFEENLQPVRAKGDEKCVCGGPFVRGEGAVQLAFDVPAIIKTIKVKRVFHLSCADEFAKILFKRLGEARML